MSDLSRDSAKLRSTSAASATSSVTEFVNQTFVESELELSKDVSIRVSNNEQWDRKESGEARKETTLQNFADSSEDEASGSFLVGLRKMYLAAFVVLLFAVCMGMTATYSATATMDMRKSHSSIHPNDDQVTWIGSLMAIGALFGGATAGFLTGLLGRKGVLMFNTIPFVIGWIIIAYAPSTGVIYLGRLITGFCSGIVSVTTPMYLVEISTPDVRGLLGASFQLFVVIGVLLVSVLGSTLRWEYLAVSGAVTSLLAAAFMIPMPESPRWLMTRKRRGEAKSAIIFLQGKAYDSEAECRKLEEEIQAQPAGGIQFREWLSGSVYKPFILSILLMLFQQFSGVNAVLFYTVQIFQSAHSTLDPILATILVSFVQVIATLVGSLLMDRAGRKPLLLISGSCMALSLIVFGGFDLARTKDLSVVDSFGWLPMVCLMGFISAFSIGFGPTPWLMVAEMTPARYRSAVSGISTALNWTFAFIVTKTFKAMEEDMHGYGVYWFYASFCIVSLFVTFFFLPETKGKSMEDIQEFFALKMKGSQTNYEISVD